MSGNPLTAWMREFQRHQPDAKPADGWRHLVTVALPSGLFDWLLAHDASSDQLTYRPSRRVDPRRIGRDAFRRQFQLVRKRV